MPNENNSENRNQSQPSPQPAPEGKLNPVAKALQAVTKVKQPITLPGTGMRIGVFADQLGQHLKTSELYRSNGEVGTFRGVPVAFEPMSPATFRTFAEKFVTPSYAKEGRDKLEEMSMTQDDALVTLASDQFLDHIPKINKVLACHLPVYGPDGFIRLSCQGYDPDTGFYTLPAPAPEMDVPVEKAKQVIEDYFSEFLFLEKEQGLPVAVAALFSIFCSGLLPQGCLRPVFCILANAEGSGKTMLVTAALVPTLGYAPTGVRPGHEDELRKRITSLVRAKRPVMFIDNVKDNLNSPVLEAFTSGPLWEDRLLGGNTSITAIHDVGVYITGNNLTITPDLERRSLIIELRLDCGKAEDRKFKRDMSLPVLRNMRPAVLGAMWSTVKAWEAAGKPGPSQNRAGNADWGNVVAGIVEFAGFGNCFQKRKKGTPVDRDLADMCRLCRAIEEKGVKLKTGELIALAGEQGCFESILGINLGIERRDDDNANHPGGHQKLDRVQNAKLGALLRRYLDRIFEDRLRFVAEGVGHARRYSVIDVVEERECCVDVPVNDGPTLEELI